MVKLSSPSSMRVYLFAAAALGAVGCAPPEGTVDNPKMLESLERRELSQYGQQVGSVALNPTSDRLHVMLNGAGQIELNAETLAREDVRADYPFTSQDIAFDREGTQLVLNVDGAAVVDAETGDATIAYLPGVADPGRMSWRGVAVRPGDEPADDRVLALATDWNEDWDRFHHLFSFAKDGELLDDVVVGSEDLSPTGMAFDEETGFLLLVDGDQLIVQTLAGEFVGWFELDGLVNAAGVAIDRERSRVLVPDRFAADVRVYDLDEVNMIDVRGAS